MAFWRKNGSLVGDSGGNLIRCGVCPCKVCLFNWTATCTDGEWSISDYSVQCVPENEITVTLDTWLGDASPLTYYRKEGKCLTYSTCSSSFTPDEPTMECAGGSWYPVVKYSLCTGEQRGYPPTAARYGTATKTVYDSNIPYGLTLITSEMYSATAVDASAYWSVVQKTASYEDVICSYFFDQNNEVISFATEQDAIDYAVANGAPATPDCADSAYRDGDWNYATAMHFYKFIERQGSYDSENQTYNVTETIYLLSYSSQQTFNDSCYQDENGMSAGSYVYLGEISMSSAISAVGASPANVSSYDGGTTYFTGLSNFYQDPNPCGV